MALTITLNGVARSPQKGSFNFVERLGSRNSGSVSFEVVAPGFGPKHGQVFSIAKGATTLFAGRLHQPSRKLLGRSHISYACTLVDFSEAFDRRIVAASYTGQTLGAIVTDVVTNFLNGEGITTGGVEAGPVISKITFNYKSVQACFTELARRTSYSFLVGYDRVLNVRSRSSMFAPVSISDANADNFVVVESLDEYRNKQYLRAGVDLTSARTEDFKGDGSTRTFTVGFPVGAQPTVQENRGASFVAKTVGVKSVDSGKDWYWNLGENQLVQDSGGSVLSGTDIVRVVYQGQFPIIVVSQLDQQIAARAVAEGHSGLYEDAEHDSSIDDDAVALEKVAALLSRYGLVADVIDFTTHVDGLRAGQLLPISHSALGIAGNYLVESVAGRIVNPDRLTYVVRAVGGSTTGVWQEFFQKLQAMQTDDDGRDNEVLLLLRAVFDSVVCADTLTTSTSSPESRVGFALAGFSEVA